MSRRIVGILSVLVLYSGAFCVAADEPNATKEELQKLEGTWVPVSSEMNGKKMLIKDLPDAPQLTMVFKDGKGAYSVADRKSPTKGKGKGPASGKAKEMPISIDATQTPKTLDVMATFNLPGGPKDIALIKGIYQLDNDTLKICYGVPNATTPMDKLSRPKEFKSNTTTIIMTLQRKKP